MNRPRWEDGADLRRGSRCPQLQRVGLLLAESAEVITTLTGLTVTSALHHRTSARRHPEDCPGGQAECGPPLL